MLIKIREADCVKKKYLKYLKKTLQQKKAIV